MMKMEARLFWLLGIFGIIIVPIYWLMSRDPTGTAALTMMTLLALLVAFYVQVSPRKLPVRPEDKKEGEIAEGAGELGFFAPYSWWPLWSAGALTVAVLGIVFGWWLFIIGVGLGALAVSGLVLEYYRGDHAH